MTWDNWLTLAVIVATATINGYVTLRVVQVELRGLRGRVQAVERRVDRLEAPMFDVRRDG